MMKCVTDNKAATKTAVAQIGIGLIILAVSTVLKTVLLFVVGVVVTVLGIRGIVNICKDK